jgi:DNA-binding SARP family transcriptional activator
MEFRILGPVEVREGEEEVQVRAPKQRGLLAFLLLNANRVVSLDRLVDDLWEDPPPTAAQAVQVYISKLRKLMATAGPGGPRLLTRSPGYVLEIEVGTLDLHEFERLVERGRSSLDEGNASAAAAHLESALALWRGPALDGLVDEPFARSARDRLEELGLAAREWWCEAELELGHHESMIAELTKLVREHPLRERIRAQLMLALYRSGRQAEALRVYQETRSLLVEELGLEPSKSLQQLERAILAHDPTLDLAASAVAPAPSPSPEVGHIPERSLLVGALDERALDGLLRLARLLAAVEPRHELLVVRLLDGAEMTQGALADAAAELEALRRELDDETIYARTAAFVSTDASDDLLRLASDHEFDLLVVDGGSLIVDVAARLAPLLERSPCDVAIVHCRPEHELRCDGGRPPLVVFGGTDHDWAALELGAWLARGAGTSLRLAGTAADPAHERRDASRLLATASLVVQKFTGVAVEPELADRGSDGVLATSEGAGVVLLGTGERAGEVFGPGHIRVAAESAAPIVFVSRGVRPGGLAPGGLTRYTWSLAAEGTVAAAH